MSKVLCLFFAILAFCASNLVHAQTATFFSSGGQNEQIVFGQQNANLGSIIVYTGSEKFAIQSLEFKLRECSDKWRPIVSPYSLITLVTPDNGTTVYQGVISSLDSNGERIVSATFSGIQTQAPNTGRTYTLRGDVVLYSDHPYADKECGRWFLEKSGVATKGVFAASDGFPIRLGAKTFVRSKPIFTITPIGATTGRVRTTIDDIALISILPSSGSNILLKEIEFKFTGSALPIYGPFTIIEATSGFTVGTGFFRDGKLNWTPGMQTFLVYAGAVTYFRVRVDSSSFQNNPNFPDSFSLQIANSCDFQWDTESGNSGGPGLCLEPQVIPITSTVSYE